MSSSIKLSFSYRVENFFKKSKKTLALIQELLKTTHHQKSMSIQPFYLRQMKMLSFVSQFVACIMTLLLARYSQLIHLFWLRVDISKRWWGKKSGFYYNELGQFQ